MNGTNTSPPVHNGGVPEQLAAAANSSALGEYSPAEMEALIREIDADAAATAKAIVAGDCAKSPATEARILRKRELTNPQWTTLVDFPCWPFDGSQYQTHAVLWERGMPRDDRVFDILLKLRKRGLLPFMAVLVCVYKDGLCLIAVDTGDEAWLTKYQASISRLDWAFPFKVRATACESADAEFAERIGCGVHDADEPSAPGGAP
jgi:hypothetical protein